MYCFTENFNKWKDHQNDPRLQAYSGYVLNSIGSKTVFKQTKTNKIKKMGGGGLAEENSQ